MTRDMDITYSPPLYQLSYRRDGLGRGLRLLRFSPTLEMDLRMRNPGARAVRASVVPRVRRKITWLGLREPKPESSPARASKTVVPGRRDSDATPACLSRFSFSAARWAVSVWSGLPTLWCVHTPPRSYVTGQWRNG
uniref:Uncharacterized protein n=1 Tax=Molossus molossus TaxID=27622 RepID=A0A7J8DT70_MOLMO|nr:hypothetical protein HJG59_009135 [Molossus molossus]